MYRVKSVLVILIILAIKFANSELNLPRGSECMTSESISGACRNYNECEVIINQLKRNEITHKNVTFCIRQYLVVCCPRPVELTPPSVVPFEPSGVLDIQLERISERSMNNF